MFTIGLLMGTCASLASLTAFVLVQLDILKCVEPV